MPNTARGGGISRKISSGEDRAKLKSIVAELDVPQGMGLIVRTAGQQRSRTEIKRDYDYLMRQWSEIRDTTLQSVAPALIYAEGDLIKRAMRDLYSRDIDEVLVEGEAAQRSAKRLMGMMMPSRARHVKLYKEELPLFFKYKVEDQLDAMHSPTVQLPSGGSIVMHATEALIAIDVNSGKSTRERHIDETAVKTNLEAADEIARQLRLRDLAGLVVIDFIDMAENRHQRSVERRLRDALKIDRARIQLGKISMFGLMELSRQRLRPSLQELSSQACPTCQGLGSVRSTESCALQALRLAEEAGIGGAARVLRLLLPGEVALYVLNQKRDGLVRVEQRYAMRIEVAVDPDPTPGHVKAEVLERRDPGELAAVMGEASGEAVEEPVVAADDDDDDDAGVAAPAARRADAPTAEGEEEEGGRKRRRRRRRRRRADDAPVAEAAVAGEAASMSGDAQPTSEAGAEGVVEPSPATDGETDSMAPVAVGQEPAPTDEPVDVAAVTAAEAPDGDVVADAAVSDEAEEAPKKPRRRRRTRKPAAEVAAESSGAAAETPAAEPAPAPEAEIAPDTELPAVLPSEPVAAVEAPVEPAAAAAESVPVAEAAEPPVEPVADVPTAVEPLPTTDDASEIVEEEPRELALAEEGDEERPARQGWWSRWVR